MTTASEFPPAVAALLREHVETYEQLEVLLALHADAGDGRDAASLAAALRAPPELIGPALDGLVATGLVTAATSGGRTLYRCAPAREADRDAVTALAHVYATQRLELVKAMSANAIERVRAAAARTFADAFLIKRSGDDG